MKKTLIGLVSGPKTVYVSAFLGLVMSIGAISLLSVRTPLTLSDLVILVVALILGFISWGSHVLRQRRQLHAIQIQLGDLKKDNQKERSALERYMKSGEKHRKVYASRLDATRNEVGDLTSVSKDLVGRVSQLSTELAEAERAVHEDLAQHSRKQLDEYKTQAFNSLLALQEFKDSFREDRPRFNDN